jgi:hypothetical protein
MNQEQKKLVKEIESLEHEIKILTKGIEQSMIDTNDTKVLVVKKRDYLRELYLKLKEVTEKAKVTEENKDS